MLYKIQRNALETVLTIISVCEREFTTHLAKRSRFSSEKYGTVVQESVLGWQDSTILESRVRPEVKYSTSSAVMVRVVIIM